MRLKHHTPGLSDILHYAHLVDEGVLLNKDGAFLVSYTCQGPDIQDASGEALDALTQNINRLVLLLDDGWMLHVDALRVPTTQYAPPSVFPDRVSALIDAERRQQFEALDTYYDDRVVLTFVWKFPASIPSTRHWFVDGLPEDSKEQSLTQLLQQFRHTVERCVGLISHPCVLTPLNSANLLSFLHTCISGEVLPIAVPEHHSFIDVLLARHALTGGYLPRMGEQSIVALSLLGYLNDETVPGLLAAMNTYPLLYRWSNRFIALSQGTAMREMKRIQKNWHNKVKGLSSIVKEAIFGSPSNKVNYDALQMVEQTDVALTQNRNHSTRWGYWTSTLIIMHADRTVLEAAVKVLRCYIEQSGFACLREDVNAVEAFLGSLPGQGGYNVRRLFINGMTLGHVLPLYSRWIGRTTSHPASLLPPQSPPVFYATTLGQTPFRFHVDVADVGHQMVLGPTGSGKSTYLDFLITQFLRYPKAHIFIFDKDGSHEGLTHALGGQHIDMRDTDQLSFCPLAHLETERQRNRAIQFIEDLLILQSMALTPAIRTATQEAIHALAEQTHHRNLTVLQALVQHQAVRSALQYYTLNGSMPCLDATQPNFKPSYVQTFEMQGLINQKPVVYVPILRCIFDHIETHLEASKSQSPTLIVLEEAWLYLSHELFARQLKDWLKTLRKYNARVIFATQSLGDLYDPATQTLTATTAAIIESCPTQIYLPHPSMDTEVRNLYRKIGLSEHQLAILTEATPKQHYYVVTPEGNQLINLDLTPGSLALAFIGLSQEKRHRLLACRKRYLDDWIYH
jgi:type IV secretion/conjugal transfer VirB4 family ATPase